MKAIFTPILDFIFPNTCAGCGQIIHLPQKHICSSCFLSLPLTNSHIEPIELIEQKFYGKVAVKAVYSFLKFAKKGKVQRILHQLKYKNKPQLANFLGKLYGNDLNSININENIALLVAVPIHKNRMDERGYNQAAAFVAGLSEVTGIPSLENALIRVKDMVSQTKTKARIDRYRNVAGIFEFKGDLRGQNVAVVDDVLTTGSTLEQAVEVLQHAGAGQVYIITIASAY